MDDSLKHFWAVLESPDPTFTASAWNLLAVPVREQLESMGLVTRRTCSHVTCPVCDDRHQEPVLAFESLSGGSRFAIACPVDGRVELAPDQLWTRSIDVDRVAQEIACSLGLTGKACESVGDRIYFCGYASCKGQRVEIYLARGLHRLDGASLEAKLRKSPLPQLIWVPQTRPSDDLWGADEPPHVLTLSGLTRLDDEGLLIEHHLFESIIRELVLSRAHPENMFVKNGDFWSVCFEGSEVTKHKDLRGMNYIARLLEYATIPISAVQLKAGYGRIDPKVISGSLGEIVDHKALDQYVSQRDSLKSQQLLAQGATDPIDARRFLKDIDALQKQIDGALDIRGELRENTDKERARSSVQGAINRAIKNIKPVAPDVAHHLKSSIRLGHHPVYTPEKETDWVV